MHVIEMEKLEGPAPLSLDCGREEQNSDLHEHAWRDQTERLSTTYLFRVHGIAAAFATVCMDALPLSRRERDVAVRYHIILAYSPAQTYARWRLCT
jgi:hypothetical protein